MKLRNLSGAIMMLMLFIVVGFLISFIYIASEYKEPITLPQESYKNIANETPCTIENRQIFMTIPSQNDVWFDEICVDDDLFPDGTIDPHNGNLVDGKLLDCEQSSLDTGEGFKKIDVQAGLAYNNTLDAFNCIYVSRFRIRNQCGEDIDIKLSVERKICK